MPKLERDPAGEAPTSIEGGEIRIRHAAEPRPTTAIKNALLQASLAQLRAKGLYERYAAIVPPAVPQQILSSLAMSWMPIELAVAHYGACEGMMLAAEQATEVGAGVGERVQETSLSAAAKKTREPTADVWSNLGTLYRVWARHYQGGSIQIVKLGPSDMVIQQRGFVLTQYRYYRQGQLAVFRAYFEAVGLHVTSVKLVSYSPTRDEVSIRITWT